MSRTTTAATWLAASAVVLTAGCTLEDSVASQSAGHPQQPAAALPSTAEEDAELLAALPVEPETSDASYNRDDWGDWITVDGCDTRARVLRATAHANVPVEVTDDCTVVGGAWSNTFDLDGNLAPVITDPDDVDVDHVVPLAEAHRSGGAGWGEQRREAYTNADGPDSLVLVPMAAGDNRAKGDSDPDSWRPEDECLYAGWWIQVKHDWNLTVDEAEHRALLEMLGTCPDR